MNFETPTSVTWTGLSFQSPKAVALLAFIENKFDITDLVNGSWWMSDGSQKSWADLHSEFSTVPGFIVDLDGNTIFRNQAFLNWFGDRPGNEVIDWRMAASEPSGLACQKVLTLNGPKSVRVVTTPIADQALIIVEILDVQALSHHIDDLKLQLHTDPLTKVASRRRFYDECSRMLADHKRYGTNLVLALVDLDGFKGVNDSCGHVIGDHVLAFVADAMKSALRSSDLVGRIGGDEFAILMPHTDLDRAELSMRRMVDQVARAMSETPPARIRPTLSVGITCVVAGDDSVQKVLGRADLALYQAKSQGPAGVAVFDETMPKDSKSVGNRL